MNISKCTLAIFRKNQRVVFLVGEKRMINFISGSAKTLNKILELIEKDGSIKITVKVIDIHNPYGP